MSLSAAFTLLELMVVLVIVAVLVAIAVPVYSDSVRRGRIIEATSALADLRVRYEQFFLDHRTYAGGCELFGTTVQARTQSFTIDCAGETATTYTATATGVAAKGMAGFTYRIDQANGRSSAIFAPGWSGNANCWAMRRNGDCS